jgi:glycosyltransferase involved in cell wall biosynthesis
VPDRSALHLPDEPVRRARPLVVSLGIVDAKKRPHDLVRAVAGLATAVDLAFVGPCGDGLRAEICDVAARHGMADRVHFTGFVDFAEYGRWLAEASVAVQLRSVNFGESSGAVHDAVAAQVPTVTSVASCGDLPAGVVSMVAPDASVDDVRVAVGHLLHDTVAATAMRDACARYAAEWTFNVVAERLAEVIRTTC